jgi:CRP-like cAMP-binding protein
MVDYSRQDNVRDDIMTALWYTFRRNGIEIPYPIRTLQIQQPPPPVELDERQRDSLVALGSVDFLAELTEDELSTLVPTLHEHDYGRGEIVCREGEEGDTFYVIRQGTVEVLAAGAKGQETHVADLAAPAFFGEMSLFTGERRSATVRAKDDVRLLIVERQGFESLFQARPSIATAVSRVIAERQSGLRERREAASMVETTEGRSQWLLAKMRGILRF